jgi:hypothetical protein
MMESGQGRLAAGWEEVKTRSTGGEEMPMFASHMTGPVAQVRHEDLLVETNRERLLLLAERAAASTSGRSGRRTPAQTAKIASRQARHLLTRLAIIAFGLNPNSSTSRRFCRSERTKAISRQQAATLQ